MKLIPTGRMELTALGACLEQLFPDCVFEMVSKGKNQPFDGFTTDTLLSVEARPVKALERLVASMAEQVDPDVREPADLVFVLDDIELANVQQPALVVEHIQAAVKRHIQTRFDPVKGQAHVNELREALKTRCSFHFAVPMIESWLFADPNGPQNAGVPTTTIVHFNRLGGAPLRDPEEFETDDAGYHGTRPKDDGRPGAWSKEQWKRHPKHYLRYLCQNGEEYKETKGGANALRRLDWGSVLKTNAWMPYARAFVADLAEALGAVLPQSVTSGVESPYTTCRGKRPADRVLRNL